MTSSSVLRSTRRLVVQVPVVMVMAVALGCTTSSESSGEGDEKPSATDSGSEPDGEPVVYGCAQMAELSEPVSPDRRADVTHGPLSIMNAGVYKTEPPADSGRYKIPVYVEPGKAATASIAPEARDYAKLFGGDAPEEGVDAITYRSCRVASGQPDRKFFAGGFHVTEPEDHGCVPVDIRVGEQPGTERLVVPVSNAPCLY